MKFAFTIAPGRGETNLLLADIAAQLATRGVRIAGTVQIDTDRDDGGKCDMDVQVLPDGPTIRISQFRGIEARGCRLDTDALEQAVILTEQALGQGGIDLLLVNKFGKHEAEGRGFRGLIAEAVAGGVPVILGVSARNLEAFLEYTQGLATCVAPTTHDIAAWLRDPATQSDAA